MCSKVTYVTSLIGFVLSNSYEKRHNQKGVFKINNKAIFLLKMQDTTKRIV
ncbi:MAG: hypothetical protein QT09_C0004G0024 [archaeon GW2011_AR18]|nr:MAG: hypothetical protein QT09_C0004G0024 [archaeon GW2011_AR18]